MPRKRKILSRETFPVRLYIRTVDALDRMIETCETNKDLPTGTISRAFIVDALVVEAKKKKAKKVKK